MKALMSRLIFLQIILFLSACAHHGPKPETRELSSGFEYTSHHDKVFLSAQPEKKDLQELKLEWGLDVVINLRNKSEIEALEEDPKKAATALGLTYYQIPFLMNGKPSQSNIHKIEKVFMKHHKDKQKVLVHCSSGQRAAAWFGTHFRISHKASPEKALEVSEAYGLNKPELRKKMKEYYRSKK
jgi:protein tyrosine phosphatase (PTP) superfamily phosphohydrolase (DUF442 family)